MMNDVFKKVPLSEKKVILKEMIQEKIWLVIKGEEEDLFYYLPERVEQENKIFCGGEKDGKTIIQPQKVLVSFNRNDERYFTQALVIKNEARYVFDLENDFYVLQRRKTVRVRIPEDYKAQFNVISVNSSNSFFETKVVDYSSGGLKVVFPQSQPVLKAKDIYRGVLHLGNRRPMELDVEVRHVQALLEDGKVHQLAGLQFLNVTPLTETKLMTITMDLHRNFLFRMEKK